MKSWKAWSLTFFTFCIMILHLSTVQAADTKKNTYKPASGGYTITLPPGSKEIYHTSTGIRFTVGGDFLVSADLYTLPISVSVPMKQYSEEQQKEFKEFLQKVQDIPESEISAADVAGNVVESGSSSTGADRLRNVLRKRRAERDQGEASTVSSQQTTRLGDTFRYVAIPKDKQKTHRPYVIGQAYQPQKNILLVVNVSAPEEQQQAAAMALQSICTNLPLSKVKYTDINLLTVPGMGYEMEIPSGWRMYTVRADNVLFGRTLSSVHTDSLMIREFSDHTFAELGNSTPQRLKEVENAFIQKVTRYTPNVTILHHEPITVGTLNGSLAESTDNDGDLKKLFIVNTYLMNAQGNGYQIRYQTDDTINYDLKLRAFRQSIESFTLLKNNTGSNLRPDTDL